MFKLLQTGADLNLGRGRGIVILLPSLIDNNLMINYLYMLSLSSPLKLIFPWSLKAKSGQRLLSHWLIVRSASWHLVDHSALLWTRKVQHHSAFTLKSMAVIMCTFISSSFCSNTYLEHCLHFGATSLYLHPVNPWEVTVKMAPTPEMSHLFQPATALILLCWWGAEWGLVLSQGSLVGCSDD